MSGYKRPYRGTKIYQRTKDENDNALVDLYKESEYGQEDAAADLGEESPAPKSLKNKAAESDSISDFINDSENPDTEDLPVKKSVKKQRKKAQAATARKRSVKHFVGRVFILFIILAIIGAGSFYFFRPSFLENALEELTKTDAEADEIYYSPLTGLETDNKNAATAEATCVMIENSVDARPQSGLNNAGVVYEAVAEGGITRFMAIYQEGKPDYIGPIRSARQTFVHLAKPYHCGYVHVGGSGNALTTLEGKGYRNLDGGWVEGQYVFRISDRPAPHNVYSDYKSLNQWSLNKGYRSSKFTGFKRIKPDTTNEPEKRNATTIKIVMSTDDSYNVSYKYNAKNNNYIRSHVADGAHLTRNRAGKSSQVTADVVIAMKVSTVSRSSERKYYDHTTTGSGEAYIFQDGAVKNATWRRANLDDELTFYDSENNQIELNRGRTWISLYSNTVGGRVSWK